MNPIETYFRIPVRIFDPHSAAKAKKEMENEFADKPKIEYAVGIIALPFDLVAECLWHDTYMMHREIGNVKEHGFDSTMVVTKAGEYMCAWKRDKFETEYLAYLKRMDEFLQRQSMPPQQPEPPKMSRLTHLRIALIGR
jgi:hypothetical protein